MALKAVVQKLEDVEESDRKHYRPLDAGGFYADVDGLDTDAHPAVGALVRAKKREAESRASAEASAKEARAALEAKTTEIEGMLKGVMPKENVERLEKSWNEKLTKAVTEKDTQIAALNGSLNRVLVRSVAESIAMKVAKSPTEVPLFIPHILPRLAVEITDGEARTRVLDADGKPSAASLEDLQKEILANKMFAAVLMGSQATGGGAGGGSGSNGSAGKIDLTKATPEQKAAYYKARQGVK